MSLRLRLTLISAVLLSLVFTVFGIGVYFMIQNSLYSPVDADLRNEMNANLNFLSLRGSYFPGFGSSGQSSASTFTFYYPNGQAGGSPSVAVSDWMFAKARNGETVWGYAVMPDQSRARVMYAPLIVTQDDSTRKVNGILIGSISLKIPDTLMSELLMFIIVSAVVLLLVGTVGSYILAGRALRVVNNITSKAQQIQTSQDLSQRIPEPKTDDEIGNLARTFNGMLARLDDAFRAQRQFVADSSHELRTPLTVIRGNLHLLKRTDDHRERAELITITEGEISRLNRMVNDLLYMAQMQAGHDLKPVRKPVELDSLLLDVFALARSMAALKDQKVVLTHEDVASTYGDRDQLQHLLLNLVDNAIKYTPSRGTISLGLWETGEWARIEVTDTGPGIPAADLPRLFDRFFRTQDARSGERDGAGLGLAIVKSIAEAHGGTIEVISAQGQGSTFRVWLLLAEHQLGGLNESEGDWTAEDEPLPAATDA